MDHAIIGVSLAVTYTRLGTQVEEKSKSVSKERGTVKWFNAEKAYASSNVKAARMFSCIKARF